jgi:hypothetical protein
MGTKVLIYRLSLIILAITLLTGCGPSEEIKTIRRLRKDTRFAEARDLVLQELERDPRRMNFWREFAAVTSELAREVRHREDPYPLIVQSAVVCAAIRETRDDPGDRWQAASVAAANRVVASVTDLIEEVERSRIDVQVFQRQQLRRQTTPGMSAYEREQVRQEVLRQRLVGEDGEPIVNPLEARLVVWKAHIYTILLAKLRGPDDAIVAPILRQVDEQLNAWPTFSDLEPSFITDIRDDADAAFQETYSEILFELENHDRFSVAAITELDLLP